MVLDCEAVAFERETGRILPFQVLLLLLCSILIIPQNIPWYSLPQKHTSQDV